VRAHKPLAAVTATLVVAFALLAALSRGSASTPSAELAFGAGDQIYVMRADGSGRTRLTDARSRRASGLPAWSPDGSKIAFVREVSPGGRGQVWMMQADGGNPHPVTRRPARNSEESTPAWSPNGRRLTFARIRYGTRRLTTKLIVADADGAHESVLVRVISKDRLRFVSAPAWSPDGRRILFTRTTLDRHYYFKPSLEGVNPDGTGRRTLAGNADGGSWSPDGSQIAFASVRDHNGSNCGSDECSWNGEIYVMNADGSRRRRLTASKGDDERPAWSPDGQHIAFQSNRNYPDGPNAEIYSMRPDGSCLTWLTNGSASSGYPAWRSVTRSSDPGPCGATARPPVVETNTSAATSFRRFPLYWLGPVSASGLLISDVLGERGSRDFIYDDCARYDPRQCPGQVQLQEQQTCHGHPFFDVGLHPRIVRRRGAIVYTPRSREQAAEIYTGAVEIRVFSDRPRGLADVVEQLHPVHGGGNAEGKLPHPKLPARLWHSLRHTARVVRKLGSVRAAAHELRISRRAVRERLALLKSLRSAGPIGTLGCDRGHG
jgi:TolB protein